MRNLLRTSLILVSVLGMSLTASAAAKGKLSGRVMIDGSSTVFPITEAVAEDFREVQPRVRVAVGVSGTGGGFQKFLNNETDINNASRNIKSKEISMAKKNKVGYEEIAVAFDGISVVVNKNATWVDNMTVAELKKVWQPGSTVKTWKDIRASWPDKPLRLYGPGTESGTFDYFTEAINGKSHVSRSNYTASADDNVLVQGVVKDQYAMAYFGFAYYSENKDRLKVVPIKMDEKSPAVAPTLVTINNGSYRPLSRPVFIYVNPESLKTKETVLAFTRHYIQSAPRLVSEVGYVPLPQKDYDATLKRIDALVK